MSTSAPPVARAVSLPLWQGAGSTIALALPLMTSQVLVIALSLLDTLAFGALGPAALASGGLAATIVGFAAVTSTAILSAVGIQVAYASVGARESVPEIVSGGLLLGLVVGCLAGAAVAGAEPVLLALGQDPPTVAAARAYLHWAAPGFVPGLVFITLRGLVTAFDRPGIVTAVTLGAVGIKAVANFAIVLALLPLPPEARIRPGMTLTALADAGCWTLMAAGLFVYVRRVFPDDLRAPRWTSFVSPVTWETLRLGIPMGLAQAAEAGLFTASELMVGRFGPMALAGNSIAMQCSNLTFMLAGGLSQATTVRVGQAAGAGAWSEARRLGWQGLALGLVAMSFCAAVFWGLGRPIAQGIAGTDPAAEPVVAFAVQFLIVAGAFQWVDGTQNIALGALRGMKDTRFPLLVALLCHWGVSLPAGLVFAYGLGFGPVGVWIGLGIGLSSAAVLGVGKFALALRRA